MSCKHEDCNETRLSRPRLITGFYSAIEPIKGGKCKPAVGNHKFTVRWIRSDNYIDKMFPIRGVGVQAQGFFPGDPTPIAYVEFDVLSLKPGIDLTDQCFLDVCDSINNGLYSLASELVSSSVSEIGVALSKGAFVYLSRLEVREDYLGLGLGKQLAKEVIHIINDSCKCSVLAIKPFPLQFEGCRPDDGGKDASFEAQFKEAESRLSAYYQEHFSVMPTSIGSEYLIAPLGDSAIEIDDFGWTLN